jgi:hypothetical protein
VLAAAVRPAYPGGMDEPRAHTSIARIDAALARIEAAARARTAEVDSLGRRHAALRLRMEEAIVALDEVIAREDEA